MKSCEIARTCMGLLQRTVSVTDSRWQLTGALNGHDLQKLLQQVYCHLFMDHRVLGLLLLLLRGLLITVTKHWCTLYPILMYRYGWRKAQHKLPHKMTRTTDNSTTAKMLTDFMLSANNTTPNTLPCTLLPPSVHRPTLAELLHLLIGTNPNSLPKSCWREHSPISPDSFPKTISFRTHDIPPPAGPRYRKRKFENWH